MIPEDIEDAIHILRTLKLSQVRRQLKADIVNYVHNKDTMSRTDIVIAFIRAAKEQQG
jgi:hypothetical protein